MAHLLQPAIGRAQQLRHVPHELIELRLGRVAVGIGRPIPWRVKPWRGASPCWDRGEAFGRNRFEAATNLMEKAAGRQALRAIMISPVAVAKIVPLVRCVWVHGSTTLPAAPPGLAAPHGI